MTVSAPLILNVDDNDGARYAKTRVLTHAGFDVIEAATGQGALDQVRARNPAVVLLDVKLPDISGIEVCALLKSDPLTRSTLVLQTSAAAVQSFDKVRALDGGADSYLTEPIDPAELVANVHALLRLHHAEAALREADRYKDQFLATLAHELRNPLAPIRNALELMAPRHQASEAEFDQARMIARRQVEHLSRLVDDLLDVSRITHGKITLRTERVDIAAAIATAVEANQPALEKKSHRLSVDLAEPSCVIPGDPIRIAQILGNLISNASKYTPDGGAIEVKMTRADGKVVISVRDNGIGIAPPDLRDVFKLFMQSKTSLSRSDGGLGIGLSLARTLCELHGGSLEAFSEGQGRGAEFVVKLPLGVEATDAALGVSSAGASGSLAYEANVKRRVMIVDDSVDGAQSMSLLLKMLGHDVCVTYDGASAIAAAPGFQPQVVLLDLGLPDTDGCEVARELRAHPSTAEALLIALTGYGQDSDRVRTRDAGFDRHLVKPASPEEIERMIVLDATDFVPRNRGSAAAPRQ